MNRGGNALAGVAISVGVGDTLWPGELAGADSVDACGQGRTNKPGDASIDTLEALRRTTEYQNEPTK